MDKIIHRFFSDISAVVTESTSELIILFIILLLFVLIVLMGFYVFHRTKKLNKLDRQIPASLVQSYLNSIIKNSSELKESLFLGGGTPGKENDILALKEELRLKEKMIGELSKLRGGAADAGSTESPSPEESSALAEELNRVMTERDELMMKVSDYQKAEKDFIDLKKIKDENQELKKRLGITTVEPGPEAAPKPTEEAKILEFDKPATKAEETAKATEIKANELAAETVRKQLEITEQESAIGQAKATERAEVTTTEHVKEAASELAKATATEQAKATEPTKAAEPANVEDVSKEEKSAEDLLKEFEKMLGP